MFELPEAKRVRREDLDESGHSSESEGEVDAQVRAQLEAQIARSLGIDVADGPTPSSPPSQQATEQASKESADEAREEGVDQGDGPEEYDFCLFGGAGAAPTKVVLEDDNEPEEAGISTRRPLSFYLATDIPKAQRQRYQVAAMSGDEVLARSRWRSWSMELPWKVTHITVTKKSGSIVPLPEDDPEKAKRRRPGKKRRIALRTKVRDTKKKAETMAKQQEEKEEHVKEKKKRLNRAKKLRKRAKNREQKQAQGGDAGAESGGDSDVSG